MKKNICLVILAIFSAVVFFIGWTQIKIPSDSVGVVISKTGGVSKKVITPGHFTWHKEFLLPTNAKITTFNIKPYSVSKTIKGALPVTNESVIGATYFQQKYSFTFDISLNYDEDSLVELLKNKTISDQDDLNKYLDSAANYIAQITAAYYLKKFSENPSFNPDYVKRDELVKNAQFYKDFPLVDLTIISLLDFEINKVPVKVVNLDYELPVDENPEISELTKNETLDN